MRILKAIVNPEVRILPIIFAGIVCFIGFKLALIGFCIKKLEKKLSLISFVNKFHKFGLTFKFGLFVFMV